MPLCVSIASVIWRPIVSTGFRLDSGSWKIIAIWAPRILRSSSSDIVSRSLPLEDGRAAGHPADPLRQQAQQRQRAHALARPGLADEPERLARPDLVGQAADRPDGATPADELDLEVVRRTGAASWDALRSRPWPGRRAGRVVPGAGSITPGDPRLTRPSALDGTSMRRAADRETLGRSTMCRLWPVRACCQGRVQSYFSDVSVHERRYPAGRLSVDRSRRDDVAVDDDSVDAGGPVARLAPRSLPLRRWPGRTRRGRLRGLRRRARGP